MAMRIHRTTEPLERMLDSALGSEPNEMASAVPALNRSEVLGVGKMPGCGLLVPVCYRDLTRAYRRWRS